MGLVHNYQEIFREVVNQCTGRFPGQASGQMSGIILNARTKSGLTHHLHIKVGPFRYALGLQKLILTLKECDTLLQLCQNILCSFHHLLLRHHIMGCRENSHMAQLGFGFIGQRINLRYPVHLIPKKFYPVGHTVGVRRVNIQYIPPHPEGSTLKIHIIPVILNINELVNDLVPVLNHTGSQ